MFTFFVYLAYEINNLSNVQFPNDFLLTWLEYLKKKQFQTYFWIICKQETQASD